MPKSTIFAFCMAWVLLGCDNNPPEPGRACSSIAEGCACVPYGARTPCYLEPIRTDKTTICREGYRICEDGVWSSCQGIENKRKSSALISGPSQCNDCNPHCHISSDRPNDADLTDENSEGLLYDPSTGGVRPAPVEDEVVFEGIGPTEGVPFDVEGDHANQVALDPNDGALVLDGSSIDSDYIWIANTAQGTISKINIHSYEEEGRYFTGPFGAGNDPSRTSINSVGDAFVAGRQGNFVTRISALGTDCPDTNGDGVITTSTNDVPLAWGEDDCILWTTSMDAYEVFPQGWIRAIAAQDVFDSSTGDVRGVRMGRRVF